MVTPPSHANKDEKEKLMCSEDSEGSLTEDDVTEIGIRNTRIRSISGLRRVRNTRRTRRRRRRRNIRKRSTRRSRRRRRRRRRKRKASQRAATSQKMAKVPLRWTHRRLTESSDLPRYMLMSNSGLSSPCSREQSLEGTQRTFSLSSGVVRAG